MADLAAATRRAVPLLIDCDTGIDDSLALLYACASPAAEIVAVTCCGGNVAARDVAANTLAVLELAGRGDIEVALGREAPIARPLMITPETHGPRGIGDAVLPVARRALSARGGVELIVEEARRRPGELTLVTLGPATNLAAAVLREPELPRLLKRVVMMVGAFRVGGNTTPRSEWNAAVDPEALALVLQAWSPDGPTRWDPAPTAAADHGAGRHRAGAHPAAAHRSVRGARRGRRAARSPGSWSMRSRSTAVSMSSTTGSTAPSSTIRSRSPWRWSPRWRVRRR